MSVRLYVGNLPKEVVEKQALTEFFSDVSEATSTKVIKDRKTGKCRGFAFVTVPTDEEADSFIEKYNGQSFMDSELKIEKALPRSKSETETSAPSSSTPSKGSKRSPSGGKRSGGGNAGSGTKTQKTYSSGGSTAAQPDPRWASDLEKLKELLQQQAANV